MLVALLRPTHFASSDEEELFKVRMLTVMVVLWGYDFLLLIERCERQRSRYLGQDELEG